MNEFIAHSKNVAGKEHGIKEHLNGAPALSRLCVKYWRKEEGETATKSTKGHEKEKK